MNAGGGWHDACILNVSSRGLMLQSAAAPVRGTYLEIRRGVQLIVAQVMWSKKHRFGVKTQDLLSVAAMTAQCDTPAISPRDPPVGERRAVARVQMPAAERSRQRGRLIEYGFAAALATFGAVAMASEVHATLAEPFERIAMALVG